jgi:hypothetical protein
MAEDLLGVAFEAAARGSGTVGRPRLDKGIDLYLRRLRTMLTVPVQVKASLIAAPDGTATHHVPVADLQVLSEGFVAFVHIPPPHDQLYERIFLIPDSEFRKRCPVVSNHGIPCYMFTAQFAGPVDERFASFAVEIDQLGKWVASLPGWDRPLPPPPVATARDTVMKGESHDVSAIGSLWAESQLERVALGRVMIVEDRIRLDPVTFFIHDLQTQEFAGLHVRTAVLNKTRRIHFEVKRRHFFSDHKLWVVLILLGPELDIQNDTLFIPSADMPELGFSETLTLDPLTKRFQKYLIRSDDFGRRFMEMAFETARTRPGRTSYLKLAKAS